ncbi:MAG: hypothetical protein PHR92_17965 [Lachnospiraceae bacterium]|nr:hypothetical protein [Lachnospiraceae bacterium]
MNEKVLVVGAEWPLAWKTAKEFKEKGYQVYAAISNGDCRRMQEFISMDTNIEISELPMSDHKKLETCIAELKNRIGVLDYLIIQEDCGHEAIQAPAPNDYDKIENTLSHYVCGVKALIDGMVPIMRNSLTKRIALLSGEISSVNLTDATSGYEFHLSQTALHMMLHIYFNLLRPEGFTFRCACFPDNGRTGVSPCQYITCSFSYDERDPYCHSEENRIVMRDACFREIPW